MARAPDDDDVDLGVSLETVATVVDLARAMQGKEETDADQATEEILAQRLASARPGGR